MGHFQPPQYTRCERCGVATFDLDEHVCDESIVTNAEVAKFQLSFTQQPDGRFRWVPYERWLITAAGRFACWQAERG